MANYKWHAVDPDLNGQKAFAALSHFPFASKLKPVELDSNKEHFNVWDYLESAQSQRVAFDLGVGSVFRNKMEHEGSNLTISAMWYTEEIANEPVGHLIGGTRWGAGIRIHVRTSSTANNGSFDLMGLAVASEMGLVQTEYTIETIGVKDVSILSSLPAPGRLDNEAVSAFYKAADAVRDMKAKGTLTPVPFEIYVSESYFQEPILNALSTAFAAGQIHRGISYKQTMEDAIALREDNKELSLLKIHELYKQWAVPLNEDAPTSDHRKKAAELLNI